MDAGMWPYHHALLERAVPRYTSYPTAAEFQGEFGSDAMASALDAVAAEEAISLYLHIPFCERICWYCGCNTGRTNRPARLSAYLEALLAEIDLVATRLDGRGRVRRIAFGGGSPNAIDAGIFLDIVARLGAAFRLDTPVISVEIDPRSFTPGWAEALARAGVTRASLGVQTLDPAIQRAIGRVQPVTMIADVTGQLRAAGVSSLNFDLMYGLPGQGLAQLEATLAEAMAFEPERIALFGYAHVPHLIPRQKQIDAAALPDARLRFDQAVLGHELLVARGWQAVGFDHFASPGDAIAVAAREGRLRRNFQGFTEDPADVLIGIGASAISQFPDRLIQSEKNEGRYRMKVLAGAFPVERGTLRSVEDQRRGKVIEQLLCTGIADFSGLVDRDDLAARLWPFAELGLIELQGHGLSCHDEARPYARVIAACFDAYRQIAPRRFSSAI